MVEKQDIYIPCCKDMRTLHIYLPLDYASTNKRYPVLYMFDGHNLFFDEDATFGISWKLKTYLDSEAYPLIIVGVECNHEGNARLAEFSPYDFKDKEVGEIHAQGKAFMEWMSKDLKQWIDRAYRTLPSRGHTGIAGSSMGGLMALYSVLHHNDTYSRAACLSPFLLGLKKDIDKEIKTASTCKNTRIYLSWGSDEFRNKNQLARSTQNLLDISHQLLTKDINTYSCLIYKGRHSEASWQQELSTFLPYLFPFTNKK